MKIEVKKRDDVWDGYCECEFVSRSHTTKTLAKKRMNEHLVEHDIGEPMREIKDFNKAVGQ